MSTIATFIKKIAILMMPFIKKIAIIMMLIGMCFCMRIVL